MKKLWALLMIGFMVLACNCGGKKEEELNTEAAKSELIMSEGYVTVDEGVELRYKTIGDGPEAVIIPAAVYMEYEFEKLADESRTLILYDQRGRGKSSAIADASQSRRWT